VNFIRQKSHFHVINVIGVSFAKSTLSNTTENTQGSSLLNVLFVTRNSIVLAVGRCTNLFIVMLSLMIVHTVERSSKLHQNLNNILQDTLVEDVSLASTVHVSLDHITSTRNISLTNTMKVVSLHATCVQRSFCLVETLNFT